MSPQHAFSGRWITDQEFAPLYPRQVFHRQLDRLSLPCDVHRNRHILFRRRFQLPKRPRRALLYITADDYYKVYLNGRLVSQGPAPAYPSRYGYNTLDVTSFLREGENVLAIHTLYQGLINRVWVSADNRHGLLCDLEADERVILASDESFRTHPHTAYAEIGTVGYDTQFLESYDSSAPEVGFATMDFDDTNWEFARLRKHTDYVLTPQTTAGLVLETIRPVLTRRHGNTILADFGSCYVGYLQVRAVGEAGSHITVRCAQELTESGDARFHLRANCVYEESWKLSGRQDSLDWFDYKCFRYAELVLPEGCQVEDLCLTVRHYPFALAARLNPALEGDDALRRIWELCVHSLQYGVQEVIQDCMEREKGFYVGDGCYTALAHLVLTGDDSIVRKLIDDAFASTFITPGMVTCLDCSLMQEIAEYPLMLISLILWHFRLVGDKEYLREHYPDVCRLLESYRQDYEREGLLRELDKWCVVEWPASFRDGYDVDIAEGKVCHEPHVAINAYYIEAIRCANTIAVLLGLPLYRDEAPVVQAFTAAFYDDERHLFTDSTASSHVSYIGNVLAFAFRLCPDSECESRLLDWIGQKGITGVSLFGSFPLLYGLIRHGKEELALQMIRDEKAWLRMLREGGTTTFEGWGKDTKSNASLFHLTMSDVTVFLAQIDQKALFE